MFYFLLYLIGEKVFMELLLFDLSYGIRGEPSYEEVDEDGYIQPNYVLHDDSSKPLKIVMIILIYFSIVVMLLGVIPFALYSLDPEPNSRKCWNSQTPITLSLKLLFKIIQGLIFTIDSFAENKLMQCFPAIILVFILLIKLWKLPVEQYFFSNLLTGLKLFLLFGYMFAMNAWLGAKD